MKLINDSKIFELLASEDLSFAADKSYIKLTNGLIIQWGSFTPTAFPCTVTFSVPFTKAPIVFAQPQDNKADPSNHVNYICRIISTSLSNFTARTQRWAGGSVVDTQALTAWFAIGY